MLHKVIVASQVILELMPFELMQVENPHRNNDSTMQVDNRVGKVTSTMQVDILYKQ
jgi:hypothetical protein